jgi:hypothetical protein
MASPEPSTFEKILASFQTRLSQADVELFRITTFDDLKVAVATIQKEQAARKGLRNLNKIKPFLTCLNQYTQVLEVFVQVKPEILGFIWVSGQILFTQSTPIDNTNVGTDQAMSPGENTCPTKFKPLCVLNKISQ